MKPLTFYIETEATRELVDRFGTNLERLTPEELIDLLETIAIVLKSRCDRSVWTQAGLTAWGLIEHESEDVLLAVLSASADYARQSIKKQP